MYSSKLSAKSALSASISVSRSWKSERSPSISMRVASVIFCSTTSATWVTPSTIWSANFWVSESSCDQKIPAFSWSFASCSSVKSNRPAMRPPILSLNSSTLIPSVSAACFHPSMDISSTSVYPFECDLPDAPEFKYCLPKIRAFSFCSLIISRALS